MDRMAFVEVRRIGGRKSHPELHRVQTNARHVPDRGPRSKQKVQAPLSLAMQRHGRQSNGRRRMGRNEAGHGKPGLQCGITRPNTPISLPATSLISRPTQ
jgi:hypothetical protein